jgi:hypothetical protein
VNRNCSVVTAAIAISTARLVAAFARGRWRRDDEAAVASIRCEQAMVAHKVTSRARNQGSQAREEVRLFGVSASQAAPGVCRRMALVCRVIEK